MKRSLWLTMGLLLVGSFVIAWSQSAGAPGDSVHTDPIKIEFVAALGHVDVDGGVVQMYPRHPGLVALVADENQKVEKGAILLQIEDRLAELQVQEAKADLASAETLLRQAEIEKGTFPLKLEQQKAAVAALQHSYNKVKAENETREKTLSEVSNVTPLVRAAMKEGLAQVESLLNVEKAKLKELEQREPQMNLKVQQATDNVEAKKATLARAQQAQELYRVRAPSAGIVLRVLTQEGATLGTSPREPALLFRPAGPLLVRAEVLQEWGHLVREKQQVTLEDDVYQGKHWSGEVQSVAQWYAPTRSPVAEPFRMNDVRTLECLIRIQGEGEGLRIGQRMRVKIKL